MGQKIVIWTFKYIIVPYSCTCNNKGNYSKTGKFTLFKSDKKDKAASAPIIAAVALWTSCIKKHIK